MEFHDARCEIKRNESDACHCAQRKKNHGDFIRLWTEASPAPNYNKSAWLDVERQLIAAGVIEFGAA